MEDLQRVWGVGRRERREPQKSRQEHVSAGSKTVFLLIAKTSNFMPHSRITDKGSKVKWCKNKSAIFSPAPYCELAMHSILHQNYIIGATKTTPPQLGNARIQVVVLYWLGHPT